MKFLTLAAQDEIASLQTLVSSAKPLLDGGSLAAFEARCGALAALLRPPANPLDADPNPFEFGLNKPLKTIASQEYKGDGSQASKVYAELTFCWKLRRIPDQPARFEVHGGGVNVGFHKHDGEQLRHYHYDVCRGGRDERGGQAQHPFAHFQYGREFADLPRLPILFFTPTDVLEQVLMDLWPVTWPKTAGGVSARQALVRHYKSQIGRIETCAQSFVTLAKAARQPLRGLQGELTQNLAI